MSSHLPEPTKFHKVRVNKDHAIRVSLVLGLFCSACVCFSLGLLKNPLEGSLHKILSEFLMVFHFPFSIYFLYRYQTPVLIITDQYLTAGTRSYWFLGDIVEARFQNTPFRRVMVLKNKKEEVWKFSFDEKICENLNEARTAILDFLPQENPVHSLVKE